jgi:5-methylcytosine-specific restriction endonuclease McrA
VPTHSQRRQPKILLLNKEGDPLMFILHKRAVGLTMQGRAEVLEWENDIPKLIRMTSDIGQDKMYKKFNLHRFNRFVYDKFTCAYCNVMIKDKSKLTIDHVIPRSKGGINNWSNWITACLRCNQLKADKIL